MTEDSSEKRLRLDQALVEIGSMESRAQAQAAIAAGRVSVDGLRTTKPSQKVRLNQSISAERVHPYVSRGGLKLAHAIEVFNIKVGGRVCLDVGASTGGFTDVLIRAGAAKVFAVDVGRGQLHASMRASPKVVNLESTDARNLNDAMIPEAPELIVCDASFIGLEKLLGPALRLAAPGADLVTLFKPQFQVGPKHVGRGGIVSDSDAVAQARLRVHDWLAGEGWKIIAECDSPIKGGDGNREYLIYAHNS